eukprot:gnl/TRDRNA2_/TRDRNA2_201840_c0_seq1.p1 gnl/TRDRNA2_/TRDRNA2_201840_c0~~gnl/TRDRNA2_/TRDRNA2_201840_c0_seq1.p1  ORF type:complete len:167 (+),score=29.38 gnl/TRDRNA2_/TRDRNA2_201840_c0_seq1:75-575(+)
MAVSRLGTYLCLAAAVSLAHGDTHGHVSDPSLMALLQQDMIVARKGATVEPKPKETTKKEGSEEKSKDPQWWLEMEEEDRKQRKEWNHLDIDKIIKDEMGKIKENPLKSDSYYVPSLPNGDDFLEGARKIHEELSTEANEHATSMEVAVEQKVLKEIGTCIEETIA